MTVSACHRPQELIRVFPLGDRPKEIFGNAKKLLGHLRREFSQGYRLPRPGSKAFYALPKSERIYIVCLWFKYFERKFPGYKTDFCTLAPDFSFKWICSTHDLFCWLYAGTVNIRQRREGDRITRGLLRLHAMSRPLISRPAYLALSEVYFLAIFGWTNTRHGIKHAAESL